MIVDDEGRRIRERHADLSLKIRPIYGVERQVLIHAALASEPIGRASSLVIRAVISALWADSGSIGRRR